MGSYNNWWDENISYNNNDEIIHLPALDMNCQVNNLWESILIKQSMSRNRFQAIGTWLRCYSIDEMQQDFSKVEELSKILGRNFNSHYLLSEQVLSINRWLIQGRHKYKQYMPLKSTKWGLKFYSFRCCYKLHMRIYLFFKSRTR